MCLVHIHATPFRFSPLCLRLGRVGSGRVRVPKETHFGRVRTGHVRVPKEMFLGQVGSCKGSQGNAFGQVRRVAPCEGVV